MNRRKSWRILRSWKVDPTPGSDRDAAVALVVTDGASERQVTVEFVAGGPTRRG